MFRKIYCLMSFVLVLGLVGSASAADIQYTDAAADHLWTNPDNWVTGGPPNSIDDGAAFKNEGTKCEITAGMTAVCKGFMLGMYGITNEAEISGGSLTCQWLDVGRCNQNGGNGYLLVTSGEITVNGRLGVPNQFSTCVDPAKIGTGRLELYGGTIFAGNLQVGNGDIGDEGGFGTIDVRTGTLIVNSNLVDKIQGYIDNDWITAYGGAGYFELDFGVRNSNKTTLTASIAGQASDPSPANNAIDVLPDAVLSWSLGKDAASHDVYFGTTEPPPFIRNQPLGQTSYDPCGLEFGTTYYWRIDEVNEPNVWQGPVWKFTTGIPPSAAQNLSPADGAIDVNPYAKLRWIAGSDADSHDVYFGTSFNDVNTAADPNIPPGRGNQTSTAFYDPGPMDANTTYYWRIDEKNIHGTATGAVWSFTTALPLEGDLNGDWVIDVRDLAQFVAHWLETGCGEPNWCEGADLSQSTSVDFIDYALLVPNMLPPENPPPYTDYCAMLSQEIQGKKHGFMAGNLVYYVGGHYACFNKIEDETIGLTHPFFHDLRSRGYGMVEHPESGYGHDLTGWEFYKYTRIAYGTVIVGATEYVNPVPTAMYWRPDRMICEYNVGGVNIQEEKFIAENDVACSIITSGEPVTIKFDGHSFVQTNKSYERTSTIEYDGPNNTIHIVEGGTIQVKPVQDEYYEGKLMYDGMSTVISASKNFSSSYSAYTDGEGRQVYSFEVPCDSNGVALVWAMDDEYSNALSRAKQVLANPAGKLAAKTKYMNDLLNYQIPYFRCSDQNIVDVYYYLWSVYLMYYIDVGKGWEQYPHTQTAVNNFLGLHRHDANFQIKAGSWTADKEYYAYGNVLLWSALLPRADLSTGRIPADNMGIAWLCSDCPGAAAEHAIGAWQIYQHTGDLGFLQQAYDYYKALMSQRVSGHWGCQYDAAECLHDMAVLTGDPDDPNHWYDVVDMDGRDNWLNNMWEKNGVPYYFGAGTGALSWSGFAHLRNSCFPEDRAAQMTEYWAMDDVNGFYGTIPLTTKALKDWDDIAQNFCVTPDTNYWAQIGMFKRHVGLNAITILLGHLKGYNMNWGIPVAPEAWDKNWEIWGDQYSNFNAGKIVLILEGLCGLEYSIPDETFTVCDNMPNTWDYMEMMVPMTKNGQTYWPKVRITRQTGAGGTVEKTVQVTGCPLATLKVQPFLEEMTLASASEPGYTSEPRGHISYTAAGPDFSVTLSLEDTAGPWPDPAQWKVEPHATGTTSIAMEVLLAIDKDDVEYFFECTTDSNFNSTWQTGRSYEAVGLTPSTLYTFRVKARDKSPGQYETAWSDASSATTTQ